MERKIRKNPSREECEKIIRRIIVTEASERGCNRHFRHPSDFMSFFQSLYPPSDALTKQVQRAIKAMDMPKDENGYYIVNKTSKQLEQETEIKHFFEIGNVSVTDLSLSQPVFLKADPSIQSYLMHILTTSVTFERYIDTIMEANGGLIIYTQSKTELLSALSALMPS